MCVHECSHACADREKRIILVVLTLQVLDNVAMVSE